MHLTSVVSAIILGLTVVSAAPANDSVDSITARQAGSSKVVFRNPMPPSTGSKCPATNNGPGRNYGAQDYTENQLTAAYKTGATMQANNKHLGNGNFPHSFGNDEKFDFGCKGDMMEYPIRRDGMPFPGGDTGDTPDRVVWSYQQKGNNLNVQYCGVIRHGPSNEVGKKFLQCIG